MKHPKLLMPHDRRYLFLGVILYVLLWTLYPHRFVASDPWEYSRNGWLIAEGEFFQDADDHPFDHRLGVTLPVALIYRLFGVSIVTTNLWPLVAALILICTVWSALPTGRSRKVGLALVLTSVPILKGATLLNPDLIVASFLGLSSLLLHRRKGVLRNDLRGRLMPVAAVIALFIAFLAKLSAYWVLPLWLWAFVSDVRKGEKRVLSRFHLPAAITFLMLGGGYLLFCYLIWDDPLSRMRGVEKLTGHHLWSWNEVGLAERIERLTIQPFFVFGGYYGMVFIFALLALPLMPKRMRFWGGYMLCMILCYWFGSTSLSSYQPLPAAGRMTLPVLPGLYIAAGWFVAYKAVDMPRLSFRASRALTCATLLFVAALPFLPYLTSLEWESSAEERAAEIVRQEVESQPKKMFTLVCADIRSPESLEFYFDYRVPRNLYMVSASDLVTDTFAETDWVFLFLNEERSRFLHQAYGYANCEYDAKGYLSAGMFLCYAEDGVYLWKGSVGEGIVSDWTSIVDIGCSGCNLR